MATVYLAEDLKHQRKVAVKVLKPDPSLGTPHCMSPEQATAEKEITGRSDIYSLAAVRYETLTGEPPHMSPDDGWLAYS